MNKSFKDIKDELKFLMKGVADIISEKELLAKLKKSKIEKRPLRVKLGVDASASDIHLGTAVPLFKLKQFQELGHKVIFLIGDFTGRIGDPSGQSKTRPSLTEKKVKENAESLKKQIFKILDPKKTEVVFNSSWCKELTFNEVIKLASHYTVAQILERDDFEKRYRNNQPISLHEFLYPLIQGYDSVVLKADIEICGTDQRFNCLVARTLQVAHKKGPEVIIMMPILEGPGTKDKMSKSLGNYIGITENPNDIFGKVMSITDDQMHDYFTLCTHLTTEEINRLETELKDEPKKLKEKLAYEIVTLYHGEAQAKKSEESFELKYGKKFRRHKGSDRTQDIMEKLKKISQKKQISIDELKDKKIWICKLMMLINSTENNSEARRLIQQKAVKIDGLTVEDVDTEVLAKKEGYLLEVGKKKTFYITFK